MSDKPPERFCPRCGRWATHPESEPWLCFEHWAQEVDAYARGKGYFEIEEQHRGRDFIIYYLRSTEGGFCQAHACVMALSARAYLIVLNLYPLPDWRMPVSKEEKAPTLADLALGAVGQQVKAEEGCERFMAQVRAVRYGVDAAGELPPVD